MSINSVKVGVSSGLKHVAALSNAINDDAQPVYPVTSTTLV